MHHTSRLVVVHNLNHRLSTILKMDWTVCFLLLVTAAAINAQSIPQFEPLLSDSTVDIGINERPLQGDTVLQTTARGLGGTTVRYGADLPSSYQGVLEIDEDTGLLFVGPNGPERLVIINNTPVTVTAQVYAYYNSSGDAEENRAYLTVNVEVLDINDPPDFGSTTLDIHTSELTAVGDTVTRIAAIDHDLSNNGLVEYSIEQTSPAGQTTFTINQLTGDLTLEQTLDLQTPYQLRVTATDFGSPSLSSTVSATVMVAPVPPTFLQPVYEASVLEFTSQNPAVLVTVEASDSSPHTPGTTIVYSVGTVIPMAADVTFSIGQSDGVLRISGRVDRETHSRYLVQVEAYESGHESSSLGAGMATVVVTIDDVNEPPEFLSTHYSTVVSEGATMGDPLFNGLQAVDYDEGVNSELTYSITMVTGIQTLDGLSVVITDPFFLIDQQTGVLIVNTDLEREAVVDGYHYYEMIITVADSGATPLTDTTLLTITVVDINDNPPIFADTSLSFSILENAIAGTIVGEFTVSDSDHGSAAEMTFSVQGDFADRFFVSTSSIVYSTSLEAQAPVVTVARVFNSEPLDREQTESYQFTLTASDISDQPMSASIPLNVTVVEVNDNTPLFSAPSFTFMIPENTTSTFVSQFMVTDADIGTNGEVDFSLAASAQSFFTLTTLQPFLAELTISHSLDRELMDSYNFQIFARDRGFPALIGETDIVINVTDVNDNSPIFEQTLYESSLVENTDPGLTLTTVSASDSDEGVNADIYYTAVNQTLVSINSSTGVVTLAEPPDYEMGAVVDIQILAIDRGDPPMTGMTTLRITLEDVNDNAPIFEEDRYNVSVLEELTAGSQFERLIATDADSPAFGTVSYEIIFESHPGIFAINQESGHLTVETVLDRETDIISYLIRVEARDNGDPAMTSQVNVDITLADANDNTPFFVNEPYVTIVDEGFNESVGVFIYTVEAQDADIGTNSQIEYSLSGQFAEFFAINPSSGVITGSELGVDFEALPEGNPLIILDVTASDLGMQPRVATTTINITVVDGNDNAPEFIGTPYQFFVPETNTTTRLLVLTVMAEDPDGGAAGQIRFQLTGGNSELFEIDQVSGEIFLPAGIYFDRESNTVPHNENGDAVFSFGVAANDMGSPMQSAFTQVNLLITDINDNSPMFPMDTITMALSESLPVMTAVLNLVATDDDIGINAQLNYTIVTETTVDGTITEDFTFALAPTTGVLSLAKSLDRETVPQITLVVRARDQGEGNNEDEVTVVFNITDANDNRPVFDIPEGGYVADVFENATMGAEVITVVATDLDLGIHQDITYRIAENNTVPFEISDPASGVITVSGPLDRETMSEYRLLVIAQDSAGNPGNIQQTFATVTVTILDANDNTPVFDAALYRGTVAENARSGTTVELSPMLSTTDPDTTPVFYSLLGNSTELFTIDQDTGVITTNMPLDFEEQQLYNELIIQVSDSIQSSTVPLEIALVDENDNAPRFEPDFMLIQLQEDTDSGEIAVVRAIDDDTGTNAALTYFLEVDEGGSLFSIGLTSGVISLTGSLDFEVEQMYMLTVTAVDDGVISLNGTLDITIEVLDVNDNPPVIQNPVPTFYIPENASVGSVAGVVQALDPDSVADSDLQFVILDSMAGDQFMINSTTGEIWVAALLDREDQERYEFTVRVMDTSDFPLADQTTVTIVILDVNDNSPVLVGPLMFQVLESANFGEEVMRVLAEDADLGNNSMLEYFIESQGPEEHFVIDRYSGLITVNGSLDREEIEEYELNITVWDRGSPPLMAAGTVQITLLDENDNTPTFSNSSYSLEIPEGPYNDSTIVFVASANDLDTGVNAVVVYSIVSVFANGVSVDDSPFEVDPSSGAVSVVSEVDREMVGLYSVQLQASDLGLNPRASQTLLSVSVADINDNAPVFVDGIPTKTGLTEGMYDNALIAVITATDADVGTNAAIEYQFINTIPEANLFRIDSDGSIFVTGVVDYEALPSSIVLTIEALNNQAAIPLSTTTQLSVNLVDINDNPPVINLPSLPLMVLENSAFGAFVAPISVSDADGPQNSQITLTVIQDGSIPFSFQGSNLVVSGALDRESTSLYTFDIEATDNGSPTPLTDRATLMVMVQDLNDNLPQFETLPVFTIREDQTPGVAFGTINATDRDLEKRAFYFIIGGTDGSLFNLNSVTGDLTLRTNVDYDAGQLFLTALVSAVSNNINPGSSCTEETCTVVTMTVNVEDWNDNAPILQQYDFGVNQSAAEGTVVGTIEAFDLDTGDFGTVRYEFPSPQSLFSLAGDGVITTAREFNITGDNKYNVVPIAAFDNPDNRALSFTTQSVARIYFVEEAELVIMILTNTLAQVQSVLGSLTNNLANIEPGLGVYVFAMEEYTTTLDLSTPPPDGQQKRQIIDISKVNLTLFAVNKTSQGILTAEEFVSRLSSSLEAITRQFLTFDALVLHPLPPPPPAEPLPTETILLILYIVIGTLGGVVIVMVVLLCTIGCCLSIVRRRQSKYNPHSYHRRQRPDSTVSTVSGISGNKDAYQNPLWMDPYGHWSEDDPEKGGVTFRERSVDVPSTNQSNRDSRESAEFRNSVLYDSKDYVMENFVDDESDNDEEAMVEIKPDTQSLSQQSTGDSTFERKRSDRNPLIGRKGRGAWEDDDLRTSAAELELTADPDEDEDEEETGSEEYTDDDEEESTEGSEEEEEEGSTEGSEEDDDEYDYEDEDPNFPENGFPELTTNEYPLMF